MSRYRVTERDLAYTVDVGWLPDGVGGYWYAVLDADSEEPVAQGGFEQRLSTVAHLVQATWLVVDWPAEHPTLVMLRDDPWIEQITADPGPAGMSELLWDCLGAAPQKPQRP